MTQPYDVLIAGGGLAGLCLARQLTREAPLLRVFLAELAALAPRGASSIGEALRRAATIVKRRGVVIVVSDLYDDEAAIGQLRRLARMGHDVIVVHTLSREELTLDVGGAAEFVDLENGRKLMVQPSAARDAYVAAVARWLTTIEQQLRRDGIEYLRLVADEPLEPALRRFLLTRRGSS